MIKGGNTGTPGDVLRNADDEATATMQDRKVEKRSAIKLVKNCRVCCEVTLQPGTRESVMIRCDAKGLVALGTKENLFNFPQVYLARDVAKATLAGR